MPTRDRILDFVRRFPGRDDDQISAALAIKPRQTVNQTCRRLESEGLIFRGVNLGMKKGNYPIDADFKSPHPTQNSSIIAGAVPNQSVTLDWFWEGNVTLSLAEWFRADGWSVLSQADTRTKQRGLDLHLRKGSIDLLIEAKGYPSQFYRDDRRSGEKKRTNPSLQAQHWYSHALLKAVRLQRRYPTSRIALAFPDFPPYRRLFEETDAALSKLGVAMFFLSSTGDVEAFGF